MKKALAFALALSVSIIGSPVADAANPKPGAACPKVNQKVVYSNKNFTCVKKGSKLVWNSGVAIAKPTATKSATEEEDDFFADL